MIALLGGMLIDGSGAVPLEDAAVIIDGGVIADVGPRTGVTVPPGATRMDVRGSTIVPGLIDSHIHLQFALAGKAEDEMDAALDAILAEFLRWGVTSIRDVGDAFPWVVHLRDEIASGKRRGPRVFPAGPLLTAPDGHPTGTLLKGNHIAIELATRQLRTGGQARAAVAELADGGVEFIKAVYDSGGRGKTVSFPKLDAQILNAIVAEANERGLHVTVHWGNTSELPDILVSGAGQLEHAGYSRIEPHIVEQLSRDGVIVDPTLSVFEKILPPDAFADGPLANASSLARAGVTLTAGTDAPLGNQAFGASLHRELELLVSAGLTPLQAITAATGNAAKTFRSGDRVGLVAPGRRADLLVVKGNPMERISNLQNIEIVFQDGRICEGTTPDALV